MSAKGAPRFTESQRLALSERAKGVAQTIVEQLGGANVLRACLGGELRAFYDREGIPGLQICGIDMRAHGGETACIRILLMPDDTYTVRSYGHPDASSEGKPIKRTDDIYCDQLTDAIESVSGYTVQPIRLRAVASSAPGLG